MRPPKVKLAAEEVEVAEIEEDAKELTLDLNLRRVCSMEDPLHAYRVITGNADLEFIGKLGKLLTNFEEIMA
jgi:hypothetical protein